MTIESLLSRPESSRDNEWEREFLSRLPGLQVEVLKDGETATGPDGWPYLQVRTGTEASTEPMEKILRWLAGRGIGLVLNPHKMTPDYVFTYGMIWNFVERGRFVGQATAAAPGPVDLRSEEGRLFGPPSDKYLPPYVRSLLGELLKNHGLGSSKILVSTDKTYAQTDLIFSRESLGSLPANDEKSLADALQWFLPFDYSIVFAPEADLRGWVLL